MVVCLFLGLLLLAFIRALRIAFMHCNINCTVFHTLNASL